MAELPFGNLMQIYAQSNRERGSQLHGESEAHGISLAEQEFYGYLRQCFFTRPESCYFLWEVDGKAVSAIRCESYGEGVLLAALETDPACRGKGHAKALLTEVVRHLDTSMIYVHIKRTNAASVAVHLACGFIKVKSGARMLDGSYCPDHDTYLLKKSELINKCTC
jgi:GNAT superfamily N-acetyltransferase